MSPGERVEARQQPPGCEGADDADFEHLAESAVGILVECRADAVERFGENRDQYMPLVCEREAAGEAMEEARAEAAFKLCDLVADRALADAKFDRGTGEIEMARCGFEGAEGIKGELGTVHAEALVFFMALSRNHALSGKGPIGILGLEGSPT